MRDSVCVVCTNLYGRAKTLILPASAPSYSREAQMQVLILSSVSSKRRLRISCYDVISKLLSLYKLEQASLNMQNIFTLFHTLWPLLHPLCSHLLPSAPSPYCICNQILLFIIPQFSIDEINGENNFSMQLSPNL
jgi:hypothetical protein